jgi:ATP-dependent DNA helicase RecG
VSEPVAQVDQIGGVRGTLNLDHFDIRTMLGAKLADLSLIRFEEEYWPRAGALGLLTANERSAPQRLAACRMVVSADDPIPTVLGVITLARQPTHFLPGAYVQFLRFQGNSLSDPVIDDAVIAGPLSSLMRRLDEKLASHNRVQVDFTSAAIERRHYLYPPAAMAQITRNAVMHRSLEATHAPVRVYWFDDRIEISNPGGPYGLVNERNFGQPGCADYRNPHIAEAMRVLGLVQRFGVGIATAQAALRDNGNPPLRFRVEATMVLVTLVAGIIQ